MTSFYIPSVTKGFSFIEGKLEEVVFERALIEVNNTEVVRSYGLVLSNGSTTIVPRNNFYASVEDFKIGNPVQERSVDVNWRKLGVNRTDPNNTIVFYHLGKNGVEKMSATKYMLVYVAETMEMSIIGDNFPCKKYQSQRDLFEQESFSVVKDEKEHTHICIKDLLTLDAAQDKAVNELKKAIEKCIDLGIMLAADCSNIVAFNTNNLKSFGIGYDGDYDFKESTANYFKFGRSITDKIPIVNCDEELFFERKDEE